MDSLRTAAGQLAEAMIQYGLVPLERNPYPARGTARTFANFLADVAGQLAGLKELRNADLERLRGAADQAVAAMKKLVPAPVEPAAAPARTSVRDYARFFADLAG